MSPDTKDTDTKIGQYTYIIDGVLFKLRMENNWDWRLGCVEKLENGIFDMPDSNFHGTLYEKHVCEVLESFDKF